MNEFLSDCPYCVDLRAAVVSLKNMAGQHGLTLHAFRPGDAGQPQPPAFSPHTLEVHCKYCGDTQKHLTTAGRDLVTAMRFFLAQQPDPEIPY